MHHVQARRNPSSFRGRGRHRAENPRQHGESHHRQAPADHAGAGGLLLRGAHPSRRRARRGQDHARPRPGQERRLHFQTPAMHAGPAADRRDRRFHLQSEDRRVRVSSRPHLRPDAPGRRNQPHHAAHAVGPAGSDGRAPRHRRWPDLHSEAAFSGHRHAEPRRSRRHLSRCPKPSSTAFWSV